MKFTDNYGSVVVGVRTRTASTGVAVVIVRDTMGVDSGTGVVVVVGGLLISTVIAASTESLSDVVGICLTQSL